MAIIRCKICGGDIEISDDKTLGACEYCGSTTTLPAISDDQRIAAFNRGNSFRMNGDFDRALAVYERIVSEDDTDSEAHWCCALCRFGIEYVEDPESFAWIPTCHRLSFDSFLEDVDYLAAVDNSDGITKKQYQKEAIRIAQVQKGILATSQNEKPFDVFICYKESDDNGNRTVDSVLAQDIYYRLTEQGKRVFFSRITLEDKAGAEYEPYIFAALNSAKVMIVIGTKPEYFNAAWVKNEWSRFLTFMKTDKSKVLLPCYRDMDAYDLPEALSIIQSYDMSKIGFLQDLIRGVNRVLYKADNTENYKLFNAGAPSVNVEAMVERGFLLLEEKEWQEAKCIFNDVLKNDAKNFDAYLGICMCENHMPSIDSLKKSRIQIQKDRNFNNAKRFASIEQKAKIDNIEEHITENVSKSRKNKNRLLKIVLIPMITIIIVSGLTFGGYRLYECVIVPYINHEKAVDFIEAKEYEEAYKILEEIGCEEEIKESKYNRAIDFLKSADYINAYSLLNGLNYKDSDAQLKNIFCDYEIALIKNADLGDVVVFGEYEQDNDLENGTEQIEWNVIDKKDNKVLLISRYGLDCVPYYSSCVDDANWEHSFLREWLNDTFYSNAFDVEEKASIALSSIENYSYQWVSAGNPKLPGLMNSEKLFENSTYDYLFVLTDEEVELYSPYFKKRAKPTEYALSQGADTSYSVDEEQYAWWWLRVDPYAGMEDYPYTPHCFVTSRGGISTNSYHYTDWEQCTVRPAVWVDILQ